MFCIAVLFQKLFYSLHFITGVALAISNAGGDAVQKESEDYIRKYGKLKVAENCITNAGYITAYHVSLYC